MTRTHRGVGGLCALALAVLVLAAIVGGAAGRPAADAGARCRLWAASFGNDNNNGTRATPFRTVTKLTSALSAGDWGCLAAGETFTENLFITNEGTARKPVTLTSGPGPRATLRGSIVISSAARSFRLFRLVLQGLTNQQATVLDVKASGFALLGSDVTGAAPPASNAGVCISVDHADDVVIDANTIHHCGKGTNLQPPTISVASGQRTQITNNFISDNAADAISLSPDAQRAFVSRNIIDANDSGIYLSGNPLTASSRVTISKNVISNSTRFGIHTAYAPGSKVGTRNVASKNCVFASGVKPIAASPPNALKSVGNLNVDPRYSDRSRGLALRPGPCFEKRPQRYFEDKQLVGGPAPVVPLPLMRSFTVTYTFDHSGGGVRITRLAVSGVQPGAAVTLSCLRGCSKHENLHANSIGLATSKAFRGYFGSGTSVRIQATSEGFVGRYKVATITSAGISLAPKPYAYCVGPVAPSRCQVRP